MIEIVCPSCGARYQVPDDSIGPEGRKVTCSGCSHKWRAYREEAPAAAAAEPSQAASASASASADESEGEDRAGRSAADFGEEAPAPAAGGAGREQQMDAIRRMLDDLKRSSEDAPGPDPDAAAVAHSSRPESKRRYQEEHDDSLAEEEVDPLRSRIEQMGGQGKEARPSNYDAARLRKMHEKRAKRLQKAKERRRRSGAFLTGFTLVSVVAAVMVGLYVMRPQIIASSPELEPAMNQYVVTVDRYRIALDEATADWRAWVAERVGPMLGGEEGAGEPQQQGEQAEPAGTAQ